MILTWFFYYYLLLMNKQDFYNQETGKPTKTREPIPFTPSQKLATK